MGVTKKEVFDFGINLGLKLKDIELIICKITDLSQSQLFLLSEIDEKHFLDIKGRFYRLQNQEPIQYILNEAEFMGEKFYVDNRVLIPRDDSEVLIRAIENGKLKTKDNLSLIDVGTGSGIMAISIIKNSKVQIQNCFAIDISKKALEVAKINLKKHGLQGNIELLHGNLLDPIFSKLEILNGALIIAANLPYIKEKDYKNMDKSVVDYEPSLALYGGNNTGFELYEKLIEQCILLKSINLKIEIITLFIEIGFDQYKVSKNYLKNKGVKFKYFKDTAGINRCIKIDF